jgi:hypothetical protein
MMNADEKIRYEGLMVAKGLLLVEHLLNCFIKILRSQLARWFIKTGFVQNSNFSYSGGTDQFTNCLLDILRTQV